jgi:ABC-2 type transport system ATP-binding protein
MKAIEAVHLSKRYGRVTGIHNLNLEVEQGEIFGLLGPNGAGKTTFVRLLLGLIKASGGKARIFGETVTLHRSEIRRHIGYVPEEMNLYEELSAGSYLNYIHKLKTLSSSVSLSSSETDAWRPEELQRRLAIDPDRRIKGSSKGTKQRVGVAQAFLGDPKLLILDEASSGLDPLMREEYYRLLLEAKSQGRTILLASHIIPEVERVCDRVGLIKDGRMIVVETVESLKKRKLRRMRVTFAGEEAAAEFAAGIESVPGVRGVARSGGIVDLQAGDDIDGVVKRMSAHDVVDLSCGDAPLEEIFAEFYPRETENLDEED